MYVRFKYSWFGPDARLYSPDPDKKPVYVPDEFRKVLPSTAVVVEAEAAPSAPVPVDMTNAEILAVAIDVADGEALDKMLAAGEATRTENLNRNKRK